MSLFFAEGASPSEGVVSVLYGWGPLQALHSLLAAEEDLELRRMTGYGGSQPWTDELTPLRLLFDHEYTNGDHDTALYPPLLARGIQ